jgi:hypothetical protein
MEYGKYIIIDNNGCELPIMFDFILSHRDIASDKKVISAGFFTVGSNPTKNDSRDIEVNVFGKSVTLLKQVRTGTDERLIKRVLRKDYED